MKKVLFLSSILMICSVLIYSGCTKDEDPIPPVQSFKSGTGYVSSDASIAYGDSIVFGISAKGNGTDNLVKFEVSFNGDVLFDSTINTQNFSIELLTVKTVLDKEVWKFVTTDIAGNKDSDSIIVTGDFGDINTYTDIVLGAQNNTTEKGFISYSNSVSTLYTMDEAFNHQADVDMFLFYENTASHVNLMTLAAPGSNITGIFTGASSPENYTTKNLTYFVKTDLSTTVFDGITNDAMIVMSYDPNNKFKKAKMLAVGDVYAFLLASGKYGLLKITEVNGVEDGTVKFSVKIQK
ncbi:MAG: hypothetical protein IPH88_00030 [Bacteroidales bacterium]|nr:hypothetical protein [Bacteroidales bacterium]